MGQVYKDDDDKAIKFGEAHIRNQTGHLKGLQNDLEDKLTNGVKLKGGMFARHKGLTPDEKRKALIDELKVEIDEAEFELYHLTRSVDKLKALVDNPDPENDVWVWECKHTRRVIAEATGENPRSYVEKVG